MATFNANPTNRMALLRQLRYSIHHVSDAKWPPRPTHLPLLHRVLGAESQVSRHTGRHPTRSIARIS